MSGLRVRQPGLLCLLMDRGRFGAHDLGLTTGGPLDYVAFDWANRLLGNKRNATCVEIGFGGLQLEAETSTSFAITGATSAITLNGEAIEQWRSYDLALGDRLEIGFATVVVNLQVVFVALIAQIAPGLQMHLDSAHGFRGVHGRVQGQ